MSQPRPSGSDNRPWNLGKGRGASSRTTPPPPPKTPVPTPPPPATEKVLDAILASEDLRPPIGRAVPESRGIRGALNHPLVMAGSGLVLVIAILYLVLGGSFAWVFGSRYGSAVAPPTAEERAAALVQGLRGQATAIEMEARLLMMGGQILDAAARFMGTPLGSQEGSESRYEFIPDHLRRAMSQGPQPTSPQYIQFRLEWDNQAMASLDMGQQVIRKAREGSVPAAMVRDLGARLRAEGLAILDDILRGDARSGVSGLDGAQARLAAGTNLMPRDEANALIRRLLTDPLGERIVAARPQDDTTPVRLEGEPAQP